MRKLANGTKILFIVFLLGSCVWFLMMQKTLPTERKEKDYQFAMLDTEWSYSTKEGVWTPIELPGVCDVEKGEWVTLQTRLPKDIASNIWLCFRTSKQDMEIYVDGVLREEYSTRKTSPFAGGASVSTYLFVELDTTDAGGLLEVRMRSDSAYSGVMRAVMYGDKMGILVHLLRENGMEVIFSGFLLLIGLFAVAVCIIMRIRYRKDFSLLYLSLGMTIIAIWLVTQSKLRMLFFPNISVAAIFSEFILFLIPYCIVLYTDRLQKFRYQRAYVALELLCALNFVVSACLMTWAGWDQSELYPGVYAMLAAAMGTFAVTALIDVRKGHIREYGLVAVGMLGAILSGVMQMAQYMIKTSVFRGIFLCMGMIFLMVMAIFQTIKDLMEDDRRKQQVLLENKAKSDFLANMSHEIRTPVNAVLGMDEMILRESGEKQIREYATDIQNAGKTLLAIINDILDFSKISSGKMEIVPREYDLASLINDSYHMVRVKALEKNLELEVHVREDLPSRMEGDEIRLRQILINLLTNAIKYTQKGGVTLWIDGEDDPEGRFMLRMTVEDTGIGIKEESVPYLFDAFQRVDQEKNYAIEGTGLGLGIVRNLVELMDGRIEVESTYGEGSRFTVVVPQRVISREKIGRGSYEKSEEGGAGEEFYAPDARVLVVDDVEMNIKVFVGLLKDTGMRIDTAASGREALEKVAGAEYDMIFLDHMMPGMDGVETLHAMSRLAGNRNAEKPVIMLTANAIQGAKEEYLKAGFRDYLSKPVRREKLLAMARKYLPKELIDTSAGTQATAQVTGQPGLPDFLNVEMGLAYCGDDAAFYREMLGEYLSGDKTKLLETAYGERAWEEYRIAAHSLKSTSRSIGADEMAELAKELEDAAREQDIAHIEENHEKVLARYRELLHKLRVFLGTD